MAPTSSGRLEPPSFRLSLTGPWVGSAAPVRARKGCEWLRVDGHGLCGCRSECEAKRCRGHPGLLAGGEVLEVLPQHVAAPLRSGHGYALPARQASFPVSRRSRRPRAPTSPVDTPGTPSALGHRATTRAAADPDASPIAQEVEETLHGGLVVALGRPHQPAEPCSTTTVRSTKRGAPACIGSSAGFSGDAWVAMVGDGAPERPDRPGDPTSRGREGHILSRSSSSAHSSAFFRAPTLAVPGGR